MQSAVRPADAVSGLSLRWEGCQEDDCRVDEDDEDENALGEQALPIPGYGQANEADSDSA